MVNVVEASMGGILALWLTGTPFSISAAVGFVSVFGVAVQDGVLLISYFNQLRAAGLPVREAVMRGAELRVRPVVMTSLTAALGLFPAAIATSIGSQAQKPLAIVVVGAMLCTLFLTRYLMPVLYSFFPAPAGHDECKSDLILGSHYTDRFLHPASRAGHAAHHDEHGNSHGPSSTESHRLWRVSIMKNHWKMLVAVIVIAGGATGLALNSRTRAQVVGVLKQLSQAASHGEESTPDKSWIGESAAKSKVPWDRVLTLEASQRETIGLRTVPVKQQTEPTILKLFGTTDYDPATVTVVRTQFDSRVDRVIVDLGSTVKKGDPLLELFSTDLAEAKSNYEAAISQWARDKKVLDYKTPLATGNNIARKELIEAENDEAQSRLKMKLAKDKLLVYGLTDKEIENATQRGRRPESEDDPAVAGCRSRGRAKSRYGKLLYLRRSLDDDRAARPSLGARERQRARRRSGRSRPETQSHLSLCQSNDRRHRQLHRQGDRFRLAVREIPHHDSAIPKGNSRQGCSRACC